MVRRASARRCAGAGCLARARAGLPRSPAVSGRGTGRCAACRDAVSENQRRRRGRCRRSIVGHRRLRAAPPHRQRRRGRAEEPDPVAADQSHRRVARVSVAVAAPPLATTKS